MNEYIDRLSKRQKRLDRQSQYVRNYSIPVDIFNRDLLNR